ncbi:MAG: dipeptide ABC transporter ATP-binding protein DppD [Gammaproteobacteria bacterium]|nr:MAG: dipeptide ABC transporter ATP-binding protein DppD [Gammaproteobacteria bacterium]
MSLLQVENLCIDFETTFGRIRAVDNFNIRIEHGAFHGIVGESGAGKSLAVLAIMGLVRENSVISADHLSLEGQDLLTMNETSRRKLVYQAMSIIFQEPTTSLNPCFTIAYQMNETLKAHGHRTAKQRKNRVLELLNDVGLININGILQSYPHQLTQGMLQRIMIAIALACDPLLLIADEPTTSLDLSEQIQIMDLLTKLVEQRNMSLVLISHDFKLLADETDQLTVMYCGQIIEAGPTKEIINSPRHPYTEALLASVPDSWNVEPKSPVPTLKGSTPSLYHFPVGCYLGPRCQFASAKCVRKPRLDRSSNHHVRCHSPIDKDATSQNIVVTNS